MDTSAVTANQPRTSGDPSRPLFRATVAILVYNVVATVVAIFVELPTRFGPSADPGPIATEWITRGTAISAPLMPLLLLLASAVLARRRDRWRIAGLVGVLIVSALFLTGAFGEAFGEPTDQVPRAVLVLSGVFWALVALGLIWLSIRAMVRRG
ncbi:MAG: hypothetical protein H0V57_09655 [Thermoleophilaceae bacterium]|nr:hypothetical protein [Thermoleophilaceae bacterium]